MRVQVVRDCLPALDSIDTSHFIRRRLVAFAAEKLKVKAGWREEKVKSHLPDFETESTAELAQAAIFEVEFAGRTGRVLPSRLHTARRPDHGDESVVVLPSGEIVETASEMLALSDDTFKVLLLVYRWQAVERLEGEYGKLALPRPEAVPASIRAQSGRRLGGC